MATIVNNNPLVYVITNYGRSRIVEAMADTSVELSLSKVKLGDGNGSYYTPAESQVSLVNEIPNSTLYIQEKELLEDNLTVSLGFLIPETLGNCDIREVGLYETINGVDNLFAIGTQQPIVKPSTDYRYFIAVEYYIMLKSANLAEVYDQIVLDPFKMSITREDVQALVDTLMATQNQVSAQSVLIDNIAAVTEESEQDNALSILSPNNATEIYSNMCLMNPKGNTSLWVVKNNGIINVDTKKETPIEGGTTNSYGLLPSISVLDTTVSLPFKGASNTDTYIVYTSQQISESDKSIIAIQDGKNRNRVVVKENSNGSLEVIVSHTLKNIVSYTTKTSILPNDIHTITLHIKGLEVTAWLNGELVKFVGTNSENHSSITEYNYITIGEQDEKGNYISGANSNVCLIGYMTGDKIPDSLLRALSLRIMASAGMEQ